jgi:hypothetical protein
MAFKQVVPRRFSGSRQKLFVPSFQALKTRTNVLIS